MVYNIVRPGENDIKECRELIKKIAFDLEYITDETKTNYDHNHLLNTIVDYFLDPSFGFFVCKKRGRIIGILLCYIWRPIVADKNYKRSKDVLIQPCPTLNKNEKGKVFLMLLDKYEKWAKEMKVNEMFLGVNVRNNITKSMLKKGYKIADILVKKEMTYG